MPLAGRAFQCAHGAGDFHPNGDFDFNAWCNGQRQFYKRLRLGTTRHRIVATPFMYQIVNEVKAVRYAGDRITGFIGGIDALGLELDRVASPTLNRGGQ